MRRLVLAALLLVVATPLHAVSTVVEQIQINARPITAFHIGRDTTRFGPLEFVGGLEMTSPSRNFGALSSFRFLEPGGDFIGVADTGFWFFGKVAREAEGRPTGFDKFRMERMAGARKRDIDAEGLAVREGIASVGFERDHRIAQFRIGAGPMQAPSGQLDFLIPVRELRQNRGFETVAHASSDGPLKGGLVIVSEKSLDKTGNIFAAVIEGPNKGIFTIKRDGEFDITDGAFLPDGDLLLLERSFSYLAGVRMQLRRIESESIAKGKIADGPVLFTADMSYQIDNMEALDVWRRGDGALIVSLLSDDNQSILQRNVYLEFILHED